MGTFKARLCVGISGAFAGACIAGSAAAQTPLVHLPFDGSVQNIGSVGEAKLYLDEGLAAPTYVEGKLGRAMHFSEGGVVAIPFNFDHAEYPQATVTAWIKDESNEGSRRNILSTGSGAGINFFAMGSNRMNLRLGRKTRYHSEQYKDGEWVFVAGIVDTQSGSLKIWQNADLFEVDGIETTTLPPASYVAPGDDKSKKQPYIFVGKHSFSDRGATRFPLTIDDVRLYAEALTPSQIEEIRNSTALVVADAPTGGSSIGETEKNIETRPSGPPILHKPEGGPQIDKELPQAKQDVTTLPSVPTTGGRDISGVDRPGNGPIDIVEEAKKETAEREAQQQREAEASAQQPVQPKEGQFVPVGAEFVTQLSGASGPVKKRVDLTPWGLFMSGITWFEKNDRPCRLNISGSDISTALVSFNESKQATVDFDCSGIGLGAFSTSSKTVSATAARPINQLRVCNRVRTNPTRTLTRLKGIEIHGAKIGLDNASNAGDVVSDQESMPNCDYWGQLLSCPAGAYATGLVLEGDDVAGDGRAEIKGMRLICHSVGVR